MNEITKRNALARLRRITGQLEGVGRMIEEDRSSVDILLQLSSAQAALGQCGKVVLRAHVETCVSAAFERGKPAERKERIDELIEVFARYGGLGRKTVV